ncbi:MAG: MFS transporter [Gammaproteobacteria bacterium]|nr:MFS transporter [Gammaproteobacteria bacterium]
MSTSALSNRNYLIYLLGSTISLHGLWVYRVALGWFAWQLTGSELWVGIVAFTQFAPAVIFGPLFGVIVDRIDRRAASIVINSLGTVNMLTLGTLTALGHVDIYVLATSSLVQGALDGAHTPVRMTIVPNIVTREQLQSAIASNSISFNVSRFVGPAIAGFIIAHWGVAAAFATNGVTYLGVVAAVSIVKIRPRAPRDTQTSDIWAELLDGVRYVVQHQTIRGLLIVIAVASVFARGALEMLPAFADEVFQRGAAGLAVLTSSIGVGAIATGLVLARHNHWLNSRLIKATVVTAGVLIIIFASSNSFWIAVAVSTVLGIVLSLGGVGSQILIQTHVDEHIRGRVSSLWGMIAFGGTAIGGILVGSAASAFGLQAAVIGTGAMCAAVALLAPIRN